MPNIDEPLYLLNGDSESPANAILQRVKTLLDAGNNREAMQQCQLALSMPENADDVLGLALTQAHRAYIQGLSEKQEERKQGDNAADIAIERLHDLGDEHNEAITYLIRAFTHYRAQDWHKAQSAYRTSRERLNKLYNRARITKNTEQANKYSTLVEQIGERLEEIAQTIVERYMPAVHAHARTPPPHKPTPADPVFQDSLHFLPVVGPIPAGQAKISTDDIQQEVVAAVDQVTIDGVRYYFKHLYRRRGLIRLDHREYDYYLSRVTGDSMDQAEIEEGDYVILRRSRNLPVSPSPGDIVASSIPGVDREVTLKRYLERNDAVILQPESSNPKHQPYDFRKGDEEATIVAIAIATLKPA
jgi:tetratricopeptide (TPR) repeat protein